MYCGESTSGYIRGNQGTVDEFLRKIGKKGDPKKRGGEIKVTPNERKIKNKKAQGATRKSVIEKKKN